MKGNAMYSSTVECNAADFQCTVQCIAVKADEGDSAAATSWRAPPILPRTALRHLHMVYVQQLSALAGDCTAGEGFPQMFTSCARERGSSTRVLLSQLAGSYNLRCSEQMQFKSPTTMIVIQSGKRASQEEQI